MTSKEDAEPAGPVVKLVRLADDVPLPAYATAGAAGLDLPSAVELTLEPGVFCPVPTGFALEIPSGYEGQVRPRSGLAAKHGVTVLNAPGTIDADYRGELKVILVNHGRAPYPIRRGDRIAQLVIAKVEHAELRVVDQLGDTPRGSGGFGHTGA